MLALITGATYLSANSAFASITIDCLAPTFKAFA